MILVRRCHSFIMIELCPHSVACGDHLVRSQRRPAVSIRSEQPSDKLLESRDINGSEHEHSRRPTLTVVSGASAEMQGMLKYVSIKLFSAVSLSPVPFKKIGQSVPKGREAVVLKLQRVVACVLPVSSASMCIVSRL